MTEFFDRNGKRMSLMAWGKAFENVKYRVLGSHHVGNLWVSTVWLGIDHDIGNLFRDPKLPPMIFEVADGVTDWQSLEMRRYRTEREAMIGHTELVHMANTLVDLEKEVMDGIPTSSDVRVEEGQAECGPGLDDGVV